MKKSVTILIFNDVEVLDLAGPLDVFSLANEHGERELFDIKITAKNKSAVRAASNGLSLNPDYSIDEISETDILILPGGYDISHVLSDIEILDWIKRLNNSASHVLSVCSGSLILAKAGLLKGLQATTHHTDIDELIELAPDTKIVRGVKFIDNGKIITSAGITTGIDMSLHVIKALCGDEIANKTAISLEYNAVL